MDEIWKLNSVKMESQFYFMWEQENHSQQQLAESPFVRNSLN